MKIRLITCFLISLLVQQCFAVSCRTCQGVECLSKNVNYRMCTKLSSMFPPEAYLMLPKIKENVQFGCLKLEYPCENSGTLTVVEKCIITQNIDSVCQNIAERIPYTTCSVKLPSEWNISPNSNDLNNDTTVDKASEELFASKSTIIPIDETKEYIFNFETETSDEPTDSYDSDTEAIIGSMFLTTQSDESMQDYSDHTLQENFQSDINNDKPENQQSTSVINFASNQFPDQTTDSQNTDVNSNTDDSSEMLTDIYNSANELSSQNSFVTTTASDQVMDFNDIELTNQDSAEIVTHSSDVDIDYSSDVSFVTAVSLLDELIEDKSNRTYVTQGSSEATQSTSSEDQSTNFLTTVTPSHLIDNNDSTIQDSYDTVTYIESANSDVSFDVIFETTTPSELLFDDKNDRTTRAEHLSESDTTSSNIKNESSDDSFITVSTSKQENNNNNGHNYNDFQDLSETDVNLDSDLVTQLDNIATDEVESLSTTSSGMAADESTKNMEQQNPSTKKQSDFPITTEIFNTNTKISDSEVATEISTHTFNDDLSKTSTDRVTTDDRDTTAVSSTPTLVSIGMTTENIDCKENDSQPCVTDNHVASTKDANMIIFTDLPVGETSTKLPPGSDSSISTTEITTAKSFNQDTTIGSVEHTETATLLDSQNASSQCFLYPSILCPILFMVNAIIK